MKTENIKIGGYYYYNNRRAKVLSIDNNFVKILCDAHINIDDVGRDSCTTCNIGGHHSHTCEDIQYDVEYFFNEIHLPEMLIFVPVELLQEDEFKRKKHLKTVKEVNSNIDKNKKLHEDEKELESNNNENLSKIEKLSQEIKKEKEALEKILAKYQKTTDETNQVKKTFNNISIIKKANKYSPIKTKLLVNMLTNDVILNRLYDGGVDKTLVYDESISYNLDHEKVSVEDEAIEYLVNFVE